MLNIIFSYLNSILFIIFLICILQTFSSFLGFSIFSVSLEFFEIINNISLSYIGSYFFYLLVVFIPEKRNVFYNNAFLFSNICLVLSRWKTIKETIFHSQTIPETGKYILLISTKANCFEYFLLKQMANNLNSILNKNNQYDTQLIHYIDVINRNVELIMTQIEIAVDTKDEKFDIQNSTFTYIDKYFNEIEKKWKKELKIARGKFEGV
jgi:hypothetical protein